MIQPLQPAKPIPIRVKVDVAEEAASTNLEQGPLADSEVDESGCAESVPEATDLEALGEEIALLSAQIQAATYRLLVMIRKFDERHGWNCGFGEYGFRSCAHWLNWRTGLDMGAAREKVRVARGLGELPKISESMRRGELSYSKVRALTRVATAENEVELLQFAKAGTTAHVERLVRAWRRIDRNEEAELDSHRRASRSFEHFIDEDGMVVLRARLEPEAGAALLKALEAAGDVLYRQGRQLEGPGATDVKCDCRKDGDSSTATVDGARASSVDEPEVSAEQRRADALGLVAEAALAHGLDTSPRGEHLLVVVHVDADVLHEQGLADAQQPGMSMLEDGQNVSAETSRRLACDCAKVIMRHDSDGRVLDVGRRTRSISTPLRRALAHRDRICQFPGCDLRYCEAHHLKHWANGGETSFENLVLLCRRHHRAVHEGGFRLERSCQGESRFFRPDGREMVAAPPFSTQDLSLGIHSSKAPPLTSANPLQALASRLLDDGVSIDSQAGLPSWNGGPFDLAWAVEGYRSLGCDETKESAGDSAGS